MFLEISSTSITNWVWQDLFSLNPCCSSNSMLELAKCLVKLNATMCTSTLHKTHVRDIGRWSDLSPFLKMGDTFASSYFHFSHYKSMETLSCHSNESTWATAIKITLFFVVTNVMNISAKFQLHVPYGFWGDDFLLFFQEFILSVIKKFCQNICNEIAIKTYFRFSHYKSMETLSCHSNESTWATAIKIIFFIETNVMNISTKFQLHPPYGFWEDFWIFFSQI